MPINVINSTYTLLGAYAAVGKSGTIAAGQSAASPVFAFRWGDTTLGKLGVVDRITASVSSLGTGFTAGVGYLDAVIARAFTASDSGGTSMTLTTTNARRRTSYGTTLLTDAQIANTAALTAGTRTLDSQAFGALMFPVTTATNFVHLATSNLWAPDPRDPLVFAQDEGFIIRATVPATGTWQLVVGVEWREVN